MDLNQKLLAAFRVEHIEHLEGIRSSLARWEQQGAAADVEEAFRRAHSLKGAARVTGLTPVETLAHRLENVFSQMRAQTLSASKEVLRIIHVAVDTMEDTTAALLEGRPVPDASAALRELDSLADGVAPAAKAAAPVPTLKQKLRAAFEQEYRAHVEGIRRVLDQVWKSDGAPSRSDVDEAFRCANSLQGAARLADAPEVHALAQRLEALIARVKRGELALDAQVVDVARSTLAAIDEAVAGGAKPQTAGSLVRAAEPTRTTVAATPMQPVETVRLSTESLDRLLQSTGQLLTESLQQDSLGRELHGITRQIAAVLRESESLKSEAAGALRRLSATPESAGIGRYIDFVEHELGALSRRVRGARVLQQRSAWSVKLLGEQLQEDVRRMRMVPAESEFQGFRKMMRDLAREEGKEIEFRVSGFDVLADRMVLQALKDPLMHVLRNAVSHGIEPPDERKRNGKNPSGLVTLDLQAIGNRLAVSVEDDGRGIDVDKISDVAMRRGLLSESDVAGRTSRDLARLLFQPGFSTSRVVTELSGRGMGLSTAYETVTRLQGEIELRERDGAGAALVLAVPLSISTHRLLLVSCGGQTFAIPSYGVAGLHRVKVHDVESVEGQPMMTLGGQLTPVCSLTHLVDEKQADTPLEAETLFLAVLRSGPKRVAVAVDALVAERDALVKSLGPPADSISIYVGGILLEDGSVSLVLNPAELVERFKPSKRITLFKPGKAAEAWRPPTILVVDDSFTTRTLETSILETNGYQVRVAVDGVEALEQLRGDKVDLVITDIQMPRLDGFGLLEAMKRDPRLGKIPVIVVSSLDRREEQQRGLSLGADAYIVKRKFDHQDLLKTIRQIL